MSSTDQRKEREQNVRQQITRKLVETGEREKLKELLRYDVNAVSGSRPLQRSEDIGMI